MAPTASKPSPVLLKPRSFGGSSGGRIRSYTQLSHTSYADRETLISAFSWESSQVQSSPKRRKRSLAIHGSIPLDKDPLT
eukprot:scaffold39923_cov64-Phaeocystis_antarctica.AAC.3